jgi:phage-related protein
VRRVPAADEKPLHWVGSAKRDFLSSPASVKDDMGNALGIAQFGLGPGVLEIVESRETPIERCTRFDSRRRCTSASRVPEEVTVRHPDR